MKSETKQTPKSIENNKIVSSVTKLNMLNNETNMFNSFDNFVKPKFGELVQPINRVSDSNVVNQQQNYFNIDHFNKNNRNLFGNKNLLFSNKGNLFSDDMLDADLLANLTIYSQNGKKDYHNGFECMYFFM